jgi:hypothetical protein
VTARRRVFSTDTESLTMLDNKQAAIAIASDAHGSAHHVPAFAAFAAPQGSENSTRIALHRGFPSIYHQGNGSKL